MAYVLALSILVILTFCHKNGNRCITYPIRRLSNKCEHSISLSSADVSHYSMQ